MFTKQHYKAITEIIKKNTELSECQVTLPDTSRTYRIVRVQMAKDLADYFAKDDSRFDREKFLEACGL